MSHNSQTIESLTYLFKGAGWSKLTTLDAPVSRYPTTKVPARLIPYLLANRGLERVNLQGIRFCTFATQEEIQTQPELYPGCPIKRTISAHQNLRSILFDKALFHPHHPGARPSRDKSIWTCMLRHVLTAQDVDGPLSTPHPSLIISVILIRYT